MECFCDYDPPEFYSVRNPIARREHKCWECQRPIAPGESYERTSGKWDGDFNVFKTCQRCSSLRAWVERSVPCFCWTHGNMLTDAGETIYDAADRASAETAGLRMEFLRRWHACLYHGRPKYRHQRLVSARQEDERIENDEDHARSKADRGTIGRR